MTPTNPFALELPTAETTLTPPELSRYARHLLLPEVGTAGQKRLKAASVLCVGTGGLGSPALMYLAAAGVGRIGIVDFDTVDYSNLQRQIIHKTENVGHPKTESARETLRQINPEITVDTHTTKLTRENALALLTPYDVILDGTDNFPTRYLINDACVLLGKPNVYGALFRFEGQASVFWAKHGACYRCLFPTPPAPGTVPSCAEAGVLGVLPGIVGCLQANEAIKLILGIGTPLINRLVLLDALALRFRELKLRKDPNCPLCGIHPTITELIDYEDFCGTKTTPQPEGNIMIEITPTELKAKQDRGDDFTLVDVREPHEYEIARIPGSVLIPLGSIAQRASELDPDKEIILHCRGGVRSAQALATLQQQGFTNLKNLRGGILAWSDEVDPTVPKY